MSLLSFSFSAFRVTAPFSITFVSQQLILTLFCLTWENLHTIVFITIPTHTANQSKYQSVEINKVICCCLSVKTFSVGLSLNKRFDDEKNSEYHQTFTLQSQRSMSDSLSKKKTISEFPKISTQSRLIINKCNYNYQHVLVLLCAISLVSMTNKQFPRLLFFCRKSLTNVKLSVSLKSITSTARSSVGGSGNISRDESLG